MAETPSLVLSPLTVPPPSSWPLSKDTHTGVSGGRVWDGARGAASGQSQTQPGPEHPSILQASRPPWAPDRGKADQRTLKILEARQELFQRKKSEKWGGPRLLLKSRGSQSGDPAAQGMSVTSGDTWLSQLGRACYWHLASPRTEPTAESQAAWVHRNAFVGVTSPVAPWG